MKKYSVLLSAFILLVLLFSCNDPIDGTKIQLSGTTSEIGKVGATVGSSSVEISGVSNFTATVKSLEDGVSVYDGSATVKNTMLKNLLTNIPGITINGNTVTGTGIKFKQTVDGLQFLSGPTAGVWFKYSSSVGDTYPVGTTGEVRTVISKSTQDDYPYGFYNIKTIQVEESPTYFSTAGITNIRYIANHKFGLVGVVFTFSDNTTAKFPIYNSGEN